MSGWIKLHRKLKFWEYYRDPVMVQLWLHLLLEASYEPRNYKGHRIETGQLIVSRREIAKKLGMTEKQARNGLERLVRSEQIIAETFTAFTIVTILKYSDYQIVEPSEKEPGPQNGHKRAHKRAHKGPTETPANTGEAQETGPTKGPPDGPQRAHERAQYKEERITVSKDTVRAHPLVDFVKTLTNVSNLRDQLTEAEACRLIEKYPKKLILEILTEMQNKKDLTKKYVSVNLTIQSWINLRKSKGTLSAESAQPPTDTTKINEFYKQ